MNLYKTLQNELLHGSCVNLASDIIDLQLTSDLAQKVSFFIGDLGHGDNPDHYVKRCSSCQMRHRSDKTRSEPPAHRNWNKNYSKMEKDRVLNGCAT